MVCRRISISSTRKDNSKILVARTFRHHTSDPKSVTRSFATAASGAGDLSAPYLTERHIAEFDRDWKKIWTFPLKPAGPPCGQEWQHACSCDNRAFVRELNPKGEVVWSIEKMICRH